MTDSNGINIGENANGNIAVLGNGNKVEQHQTNISNILLPSMSKINWSRVLIYALPGSGIAIVVILVWQAADLFEQALISNMVQRAYILGGCLISASLISLPLFRGKEKGREQEPKDEKASKQSRKMGIDFKPSLNIKAQILFWVMITAGLALIFSGVVVQQTFNYRENKCLSVIIPPSFTLGIFRPGGVGKIVFPDPGGNILLSPKQIDGLANLSGQLILNDSTDDCSCKWRGRINNAPPTLVNNPAGPCAFSMPLPGQVTKINLQLEISGATEFYQWWGLTASSQTKPFMIWVRR